MFRKNKVCQAALLAIGGITAFGVQPVFAQDTQRVEITGSSVRRIDAEASLPVQVIKKEEIARTGATNTAELLQRMAVIQGSFGESSSVGGSSGGFTGVSIHNIGESRTLVLLNGHRLVQFGGQTLTGFAAAVDLNAIPISAIERIEILTDGASALYGSDAVAGVVNFITKRDSTDGEATIGFSSPKGGARETRVSVSKGFGSLDKDNFNFLISAAHDERTKLNATDRDFGKTGRVFFNIGGQNYRKQQFSASPIPANATDDQGQLISPYLLKNGKCPDKTFRVTEPYNDGSGLVDDYCGFDFVGELEIFPVRKRDTAMLSGTTRVGEHTINADLLYAQTQQISRIAPVPGSISIPAGTPLHNTYLLPLGITGDSLAFYRLYDLGKRENNDKNSFVDFSLKSSGMLAGWDYTGGVNYSRSENKSSISGYPGALAVKRLRASGLLDPFVGPGQQSSAANAAIAAANYNGYWDGGVSELTTLGLSGSREIGSLAGGPIMLGTGVNYNIEKFQKNPSLFAQGLLADPVAGTLCNPSLGIKCDSRFGDAATTTPYSANRKSVGAFGELVFPITKAFEATTAARFDHYSDFGDAITGKASFKWRPMKEFLIRGSVGSGFRAPTEPKVNATLQPYGVTTEKYTCSAGPPAVATSLGAVCQTGNRQYDQLAGGNPALKPEKSMQASIGIRFEPSPNFSAGADLWHVNIRDSFGQLTEDVVFADPQKYASSWGTKVDTGTGVNYLAFKAVNLNLGREYYTGIDFDVATRTKVAAADVSSQVKLTYMVREAKQLDASGPFYSAIDNFAELGTVTFRWQGAWTNVLRYGNWSHTATVNFKSGYKDKSTSVDLLDANGNVTGTGTLRMDVGAYSTIDWQTVYTPFKNVTLTAGALNLFDRKPPLAISTGGTNRGQQFGYDDRYYDSRGRIFYINGSYKF